MNEEFPKDIDNIDAEYEQLLNDEPVRSVEDKFLDDHIEEQNQYLARIIPVLQEKDLIPGSISDDIIDCDALFRYSANPNEQVRDFAHRTFILMDMVTVADQENKNSRSVQSDYSLEILQESTGDMLKNNPEYEQWIEASKELVGDLLPLSDDSDKRASEIEMLTLLSDAVSSQQNDSLRAFREIEVETEKALVSIYGHHDDIRGIARVLALLARTLSKDSVINPQDLHKDIMQNKSVDIDPGVLHDLLQVAIDRNNRA